jgi:hypothetical protein
MCPDGETYAGTVNIDIDACDDGDSCRVATRSAMNTNNSLLGMIKDALIGKTYAAAVPARHLPEGIAAIYYNINSGDRQTYN